MKALIYSESPLSLKDSVRPDELIKYKKNPQAFGQSYIHEYQSEFIGLKQSWSRLKIIDKKYSKSMTVSFLTWKNTEIITFTVIVEFPVKLQ